MRWPWTRRRHTFDSQPRPLDQLFAELARTSGTTITRADALSVAAVRRGRNLICSVATMPLEQHGPDNALADSALLRQIDPDVPNVVTISQTIEDLVFEGISWWEVTARDFAGFPVAARHLDVSTVSVDPPQGRSAAPLPSGVDPRAGVVWIDGNPVPGSRVIRFDSPNPAVLTHAGREIRRAILLDKAAGMYADDPRPLDYFTPADGAEDVDDEEVTDLLAKWRTARKKRGTAFVPNALSYHAVDAPSPQQLQLVELQRQASLDIANALGIDPEDLGLSTTSRTYANDVDRRRNKLNEVLSPYMRAITDRLSMGDVTRRGYTVRFNTGEYLMPNPSARWQVYQVAHDLGVMTDAEIREAEGMPPLPPGADTDAHERPGSAPPPEAEPEPDTEAEPVNADRPATVTFDGPSNFTLDMPVVEFSVDRDNRIIEGLAVPYGQYGSKGGMTFRFDKGAMQWDTEHPGRVKLVFPRHGEAVGKAIQLRNTSGGLLARFKVGRGPEGDRALTAAEDGVFDGLSVGVDFDARADTVPDPRRRDAMLVRRADLRHVALTDEPVFDNARVTRVAASRTTGGSPMADTDQTEPVEPSAAPDPQPVTFSAEQVQAILASLSAPQPEVAAEAPEVAPERPEVVNPTRTSVQLSNVREAVPYRFDRGGNFVPTEHVFSADLHDMAQHGDAYGESEAGKRVMGLLRATFDVDSADVNELTPNIQRPDMYVDQQDYRYPIWNAISKGAPPNGVQPFTFPKFNTAAGLVGDHTEGTEPAGGTFTATNQTVTPTAVSGKANITREVWEMGGNPAVSTLIFNQMVRGYREGLEQAGADFLATLTAATDIALTTAAVDDALAGEWDQAVAGLQFVRGYDFEVFVVEQVLYQTFVDASSTDGRKLFPQINPQNANGTAARRFARLDLGGVDGIPSWALASTPGSSNSSWLFDPMFVHGWSTPPQRLEFPGSTQAGAYAPVAFVDIAIWGYKALANSDIGGVRQVTYDSTV